MSLSNPKRVLTGRDKELDFCVDLLLSFLIHSFFLLSFYLWTNLKHFLKMHSKRVLICCYVFRSSPPEVFLGESVLKICSKITGEHPCQSMISIKLLCSFIEIALWHGCSSVNLLHISRTPFLKNTYGGLLLSFPVCFYNYHISNQVNLETATTMFIYFSGCFIVTFVVQFSIHR